jgi:hypothetical protein
MRSAPILALLALLTAMSAAKATKVDLLSLGSSTFTIDPGSSILPTQSTTNLVVNANVASGNTFYNNTPFTPVSSFNWSGFSNYGMTMTLLGGSPIALGFSVSFYDDSFSLINTYDGSTEVLTTVETLVDVDFAGIAAPGSGDYSNVQYLQFTWGGDGAVNLSLQNVYGLPPQPPEPAVGGSFTVRAPGGVRFLTSSNNIAGVVLPANATSWASLSDSNAKTSITVVDHRETLRKVSKLPVTSWQYKHDPSRRYIGPMAQDFHAAFGLGQDDKHVGTLDSDGVTLSALKGLIEELQTRKARSAAQAKRLEQLQGELEQLRNALSSLPPGPAE